jgi:hypothetical protein
VNRRVEQERMYPAVPGHVHEPRQLFAVVGRHPAQAPGKNVFPARKVGRFRLVARGGGVQFCQHPKVGRNADAKFYLLVQAYLLSNCVDCQEIKG